jgi:outer membrane lipoprotein-sorting protein
MRIISFIFVFVSFFGGGAHSVQAQDANKIMKTASAKFKSHKSVESNYTIVYTEGTKKRSATGGIIMQKNKYVNLIEGNKTWFNGKTMWTYVKENEEVNVTEPSNSDMLSNNPYFFINSYSKEYNATLQNSVGNTYDVKLTPKNSNEDVKYVILKLLKGSYQPVSLSIVMKKSQMDIVLNTFKTGKAYKNSSFSFDKNKYPDAEIIDLR